jgi:Na+-transporting methylmalonyl-CoA/oxaloacetate decarboxylase gamma subunit
MDIQLMGQGFEVMIFGLGGVFAVLILFYIATKIMLGISRKQSNKSE